MAEKYPYSAEREIFTFAYLYKTAESALEHAKEIPKGSFYQLMSSLVFSAFALEAYLNHLGEKILPFWAEIERIKTLGKLKVLYTHLGLPYDKSSRPIQTVVQLFRFRNFMAHGRTETVEGTGFLPEPDVKPGQVLVEAEWEKFCNEAEAGRALEDIKAIIEALHTKAGLGSHPLSVYGSGSYSLGLHTA